MTLLLFISKMLASGFFVSYLPVRYFKRTLWTGAGILGALWGVLLLPWLPQRPATFLLFLGCAVLVGVGICSLAEIAFARRDDPRILLDETLGFWAAVATFPFRPALVACAFLLFRLFDVYKPNLLRSLERLPKGWGVVLDDIGAGLITNLILQVLHRGLGWL